MAPPTNKPPPLPVAADHAALQNRISLALASQTSILKSMNLPARTSSARVRRPHSVEVKKSVHDEDNEDDFSYQPPNQGLGYRPTGKEEQMSAVDKNLRGRLLGKRGKEGENGVRKVVDEDEDEDEGRTGLGRKKRKRDQEQEQDQNADAEKGEILSQEPKPIVAVVGKAAGIDSEQFRGVHEREVVDTTNIVQSSPANDSSQQTTSRHESKKTRSGAQRRQKRKNKKDDY